MGLHVFDMDGTLLRGTTASLQIARHLGCMEELTGLETRFAAGQIDTRVFATAIYGLWQSLTGPAVAKVFGAVGRPPLDLFPRHRFVAVLQHRDERGVD
jgi:phosphoserine phosphatase